MTYINSKYLGVTETIDQFDTCKEAKVMLVEYRIAYAGTDTRLWLSGRATKEWREAMV